MIENAKYVDRSFDQLTEINRVHKKPVEHQQPFFVLKSKEKKYSYHHDRVFYQKTPMINVSQSPIPIIPTKKYFDQIFENENPSFCCISKQIRPKNFRVRVFRNGDDTLCAYCASCSMDIVKDSFFQYHEKFFFI